MKKYIFLLVLLLLFVSCKPNDQKLIDRKNDLFLETFNSEEKEIIKKISEHKDFGLYKYETKRKKIIS